MQPVLSSNQVLVRINGVLPDISRVSNVELSERSKEIKMMGEGASTSCSIISNTDGHGSKTHHVLIDVGPGIVNSLQKIPKSVRFFTDKSYLPDELLITHSHEDHIADLPLLLSLYENNAVLKIYCTSETRSEILNKFSHIRFNSCTEFVDISPSQSIDIGSFLVIPISVNHFDYGRKSSLSGCVMYVVMLKDTKVIIGWDFLTINDDIDQRLLWNPDLLILGTETYNSHPSAGMISIEEAITLIRRWNAKNSYVVHYSGLMDMEDRENQWFRGPVKPLTSQALQQKIDEQLRIAGDDGKFKVTVANEGMTWKSGINDGQIKSSALQAENPIIVESLEKYILQMGIKENENKLNIEIEDRIYRHSLEFVSPFRPRSNENMVFGRAVKWMMAKGPELKMEIITNSGSNLVHIEVLKGKKFMFNDDIYLSDMDAGRIRRFIGQYIPLQ